MRMLGLGIEEVLCELKEDLNKQGLPPGFRFHPTDEELITFYLASQVYKNINSTDASFSPSIKIAHVDLNRCEPWDLPDVAKMGEREWYFFSTKDRKYPAGIRTNRATQAGYWKATGKDRQVHENSNVLVGMKKTLVFYKGRAPRGEKTSWVMHEYRLDGQFSCRHTGKEEWVICRIFHKTKERKPPIFQGQHMPSYFSSPSYSSSSPPTATPIFPNPPLSSLLELDHEPLQQANLLNITNNNKHICLPINGLQLPSHHLATHTSNRKDSETNNVLIKSFLSRPTPIAITIPQQCKTGVNYPPFLVVPKHHANLPWGEQQQHSDSIGLDFSTIGFSPLGPTTAAADHSLLVGASTYFESVTAASGESWPPLGI